MHDTLPNVQKSSEHNSKDIKDIKEDVSMAEQIAEEALGGIQYMAEISQLENQTVFWRTAAVATWGAMFLFASFIIILILIA